MNWFSRGDADTKERARELVALASQTIDLMDSLLATLPAGDARREPIERHMRRRLEVLEASTRLALGRVTEFDGLDSVTRHYMSLKETMQQELRTYGRHADIFVR